MSELKGEKNPVKNSGNHKSPKKRGDKGQEKGNCERPYYKITTICLSEAF
jgi:hypothetical protein